jgi:hypothetical protein
MNYGRWAPLFGLLWVAIFLFSFYEALRIGGASAP